MTCFDEQPDGDIHGECAAEIKNLQREVAHWKNNHATVVAQARVLKERTDMPIERVKAYEGWQKATEERDELAAQVEVMRSALVDTTKYLERTSNRWDGINGKHPATVVESARAALALPNTAANILKKRDARVLRDAAKTFEHCSWWNVPQKLIKMADELEKQHG